MGSKRQSGLNSGISGFQHGPGHRSYWDTFKHMFPENEDTDAEFQTIQFKGRKTVLFIPYWLADPKVDRPILGQREKTLFRSSYSCLPGRVVDFHMTVGTCSYLMYQNGLKTAIWTQFGHIWFSARFRSPVLMGHFTSDIFR